MKFLIYFVFAIIFVGCNDGKQTEKKPVRKVSDNHLTEIAKSHPGKKFLENEC